MWRLREQAARKLYPILHSGLFADMLGCSPACIAADGEDATRRDVLEHLARIAHGGLDAMRCTLALLRTWLVIFKGRDAAGALHAEVSGASIVAFLSAVAQVAKEKATAAGREDKGHAAPNRFNALKRCSAALCYEFNLDAPAVATWVKENRVSGHSPDQAPMPSIAHVLWIHVAMRAARAGGDAVTTGFCAQLLAVIYFTLRLQLAARSGRVDAAGALLLVGVTGVDYKKPSGSPGRNGRPMMAGRVGFDGRSDWGGEFVASMPQLGEEVQPFMLRDNNSPDGNLHLATAWGAPTTSGRSAERPMPRKRVEVAQAAILSTPVWLDGKMCHPPFDRGYAKSLRPHGWKRMVPPSEPPSRAAFAYEPDECHARRTSIGAT